MSFKEHFLSMPVSEREALAAMAGTKRSLLNQVVYADKRIELGLGYCLAKLCNLPVDAMPLTERARHQHKVLTAKPRKAKQATTA